MQKWEYKVLQGYPSEAELDQLGQQGWELIAVVPSTLEGQLHGEFSKFNLHVIGAYTYLKRPA